MNDDELTRLAEEELLREGTRGEARVAVHGVMAWLGDKAPRTNKRFLSTTLSNALQHNHRQRSVGNSRSISNKDQVDGIGEELSSKKSLKRKEMTDSPLFSEKSDKVTKRTQRCDDDFKSSKKTSKDKKESFSDVLRTKHCDSRKNGSKISSKVRHAK